MSLTELDVAVGRPLGFMDAPPPRSTVSTDPRRVLEASVREALAAPPCLVMFSGGRDSSALLALSVHIARREGLPEPVPVTYRFPGVPESDESQWQELTVRHLGLGEWHRIDLGDTLDFCGPLATGFLHRKGLRWPPNAHAHLPAARAARGGSLITGAFGDEVLSQAPRMAHLRRVVLGRARPTARDVGRVLLFVAPASMRRLVFVRRPHREAGAWLTPEGRRSVVAALAREDASRPLSARAESAWWWSMRWTQHSRETLRIVGEDAGCRLVAPFAEPAFSAALSGRAGFEGSPGRAGLMAELFGDLLPPRVTGRTTKATFAAAFWGEKTRAFASSWDGTGVPRHLMDVETLRRYWLWRPGRPLPPLHFSTALALGRAWLAARENSPAKGGSQLTDGSI